jgi:hypothetical protein
MNLTAQDTIVLDGIKIPKEKFNPYSGLVYEVDLKRPGNMPSIIYLDDGKELKIKNQQVFTSKGMKSFAIASIMERVDSSEYDLPYSSLKFFNETGNVKWEKQFEGILPRFCFLSPDGKYSIFDCQIWNSGAEFGGDNYSLSIFDENGEYIFEHPSPIKYVISKSRDFVCYKEDDDYTDNYQKGRIFYCFDLKSRKLWCKAFTKKVYAEPISSNGDYIIAWLDSTFTIYYRDGKEIFHKHSREFSVHEITNDGKYALTYLSSTTDTTYFKVIGLQNNKCFKTNYYVLPEVNENSYHIYNGASFVNNSYYLIALTSIIAPDTGMIIFHNLYGEYIGHKVYYNIPSSFYNPNISLLSDGSFEVYMDGYNLGNLTLPGVNTKQYLSKTAE